MITRRLAQKTSASIIDKFFRKKQKYWYVLALNENVDRKFTIPNKLKCVACDHSLKIVIAVQRLLESETQEGKLQEFLIVKTPHFIHPSGVVPVDKAVAVVSTTSDIWPKIKFLLEGRLDRSVVSKPQLDIMLDFIENKD